MPRRHQRAAEVYEPLDLTPPPVGNYFPSARIGDPVSLEETRAARTERLQREREHRQRQINARINRGIDWHICLVPGCGDDLTRNGRTVNPSGGQRDHTLELPLCYRHLAAVSLMAFDRDDPLLISAVADVIERREARAVTQKQAAKKAWLKKTDGHIYWHVSLIDDEDDYHPFTILTRWAWMTAGTYQLPEPEVWTISNAAALLDKQLSRIAQDPNNDFTDLAEELRKCRSRIQSALRDSDEPERGAPCPTCKDAGKFVRLIREYAHWCENPDCEQFHFITDDADVWVCPRNRDHWWTIDGFADEQRERTSA